MKRATLLFFFLSLFYSITYSQTPANDKNWETTPSILNEDFNGLLGSLPNPSIWNPNRGWYDYGVTTDIIFTFWPTGNAYLDGNSNLILRAQYVPDDPNGHFIHSGAINSKTMAYGYGYYEIRCKLNSYSRHFMPAFWVWGGNNCDCSTNGSGCSTGWYNENDFFETVCDPNHFDVTNNVHNIVGNCTDNWNQASEYFVNNNDLFNNFHTYGYEWTPEKIIYYLDGVPYKYFKSPYVANHPLSICVDLGWTEIDASFYSELNSLPESSREMTIDYIKVYNLKRNCTDETISNFNSGTYSNYSVKNTITINGTSQVMSGNSVTLRAQNGITINGDFTLPIGGELTLLPTNCY